MFFFLSKFLPLFVYPLGLACVLLVAALAVRRRPRWQTTLVALTLVLLWLSGTRPLGAMVIRSLERQHLPPATVPQAEIIVVLGGGSRTADYPRSTPELNEAGDRLLHAAWLYRQQAAPRILLSGGKNQLLGTARTPEAETMAEIMTMMGVPRETLILESTSRNTYENALEIKKILDREGISEIILVTSATHMPRAYRIFTKMGLTVTAAPTDFLVTDRLWVHLTRPEIDVQLINLLPTAENLEDLSTALKEYIGLVIYWWRGWL